jgi:hypothetical protein
VNGISDAIVGLLLDGIVVCGVESRFARHQKLVQVPQCRQRDLWCADRHAVASDQVELPGRHHCDVAWRQLEMSDLTGWAPLREDVPYVSFIQRMPTITDGRQLPDMGTMTARL